MSATVDLGGEVVERTIPNIGELRFENFAAGEWLTKKGEPAKKARRRYQLNGDELDAVSSIVDTLSKPGLMPWYEDHGARGAVKAERMGELAGLTDEEIIGRVRMLKLGAENARDEAAERGSAIHLGLHSMARTGEPPRGSEYPGAWQPWVRGSARVWLALNPEPIEAEVICCHPEHGYAGRPDLIARCDGKLTLLDYKTGKGRIYDQAHYQTRLYEMAKRVEGMEIERIVLIGIDDDGGFQLVDCEASDLDALALVHTYRARKRINAGMAKQRAVVRKALA